jgi:hypothetical protein
MKVYRDSIPKMKLEQRKEPSAVRHRVGWRVQTEDLPHAVAIGVPIRNQVLVRMMDQSQSDASASRAP